MGLLALGGAISGMGQGLQHGLQQMQSGIQQAGLMKEDRDFQMKKLELQQTFESQREQRGYTHAETLAKQNQDFQTGLHEGDRAAASAENEIKRTQDSIEKGKDRELKDRELSIAEKAGKAKGSYYEAYADYLKHGGKSGSSAGAKVDMETRKAGAAFYSSRIAPLEKQLIDPLTPEDQKKAISDRIEELSKEGLGILGFTFGKDKGKDPQAQLKNGDPFAGSSPLSEKSDTAPKQGKGLLSKVPAAPPAPKSYDQRVEEQLKDPVFDQLQRYLEQPSGPPVPPGPGVSLPNAQ
jgi:hypothetical protein